MLVAVPAKVRREIAAAELGDRDRLTFASAGREAVSPLQLGRPERLMVGRRPAGGGLRGANPPSRDPTLVETEHAGNDAAERARDLDVAFAPTELPAAGRAMHAEARLEGGLDLGRRAAHNEAAG